MRSLLSAGQIRAPPRRRVSILNAAGEIKRGIMVVECLRRGAAQRRALGGSALTALVIAGLALVGCSSDDDEMSDGRGSGPARPDAPDAPDDDNAAPDRHFVYIESNDPAGNSILAFERPEDGSLSPLRDGRFDTGGIGISAGVMQRLGPLDSDQNLVLSGDRRLLFAVNSGSNSISVFHTAADGMLSPVEGSPFDSGGENPVSLGLSDDTLYVVNKAADGSESPSYTVLDVADDGSLTALPDGAITSPMGGSPSIAHVAPGGQYLFGTQFLDADRAADAPMGQIDAFAIGGDRLTPAPGSPYALPADDSGIDPAPPPVALDLVAHPTEAVLYVGFVTRSQLGVYTIGAGGALTFVRSAANSGMAICWFLINREGTRLYSVNSGSASVSVYDISDALNPVETSALTLKLAASGPPFMDAMGMEQTNTSQPFQLAFDADQSHIYLVSQRATTNATDLAGNYLHVLEVASDGSLSEPAAPLDLRQVDLSPQARPQGVLLY